MAESVKQRCADLNLDERLSLANGENCKKTLEILVMEFKKADNAHDALTGVSYGLGIDHDVFDMLTDLTAQFEERQRLTTVCFAVPCPSPSLAS